MVFLHLSAFFMILSLRFMFSGVWGWSSKKLQCFRRECLKVSSLELINGVEFRTLSSVMMARLCAPRNIRGANWHNAPENQHQVLQFLPCHLPQLVYP